MDERKHDNPELEPDAVPEAEADTVEAEAEPMDPMAELQADRDALYERLLRVSADYQNYQRRAEKSVLEARDSARVDLLRQFVPVLDHFDHALGAAPDTPEAQQVYGGLKIVRDELLKVLHQAGVSKIEPAVGDAFDPHHHEAMMKHAAEGVEPGHISMIMQPGYAVGPRTLRAAKVAVVPSE